MNNKIEDDVRKVFKGNNTIVFRYELLKFGNFCNSHKRNSFEILLGMNNWS